MSFVWLKRTLFGQGPAMPSRKAERRASLDRSSGTTTDIDLESQRPTSDDEAAASSSSSSSQKSFLMNPRVISDATIGLSDGLTVPFALTAGLSALGDTKVVIFGGLAELIAGAISMGLGGYLGAKSEAASYKETRRATTEKVNTNPQGVATDLRDVFSPYDIPVTVLDALTSHMSTSPHLVDFLMQFKECAEEPAASRAFTSALTIAGGYFFGGLLPLIPYFCVGEHGLFEALYISIGVMAVALFTFGYGKTCIVTGWTGPGCVRKGLWGGIQMVLVGGAAAGAAMGLVKAFNQINIGDGGE